MSSDVVFDTFSAGGNLIVCEMFFLTFFLLVGFAPALLADEASVELNSGGAGIYQQILL